MTREEIAIVLAIADKLPDAEVEQTDDGAIIIRTGLKMEGDFFEWVTGGQGECKSCDKPGSCSKSGPESG